MTARRHLATAAVFALLAVAHTWPLAAAPGRHSRIDNGDYALNAWILAWVAHQAPRDPLHLFDANIFHPEPNTLAFSEHLVPQAAFAAPVRLAGGSAVLAYNLVLLAGFFLSGWATCTVLTRWTGDWTAGLLAGSLLAFNAHTLTRLTHIQTLHLQYLPLALLALDEVLRRPSWRASLKLAAFTALQALTSGYLLVFTAVGLTAAALARAREWWDRERFVRLAAGAALATAVIAPFLIPYAVAQRQQGLSRPYFEIEAYSASWIEYVTTAGRLHMQTPLAWGYEHGKGSDTLFPGVVALLLTAGCLASGRAFRDPRARMCLALGAAGVFFSLGSATGIYHWLYTHVPPFQAIRLVARFGLLALVAVAVLAAFALADLRGWLRARGRARAAAVVGAAALVLVHAEAARAPVGWVPFTGFPPIYRVVAALPDVVLAELPMYRPDEFFLNADYVLASTTHWKPIVNGYSGYQPDAARALAATVRRFPDPESLAALGARGVTHVLVHCDRYGPNCGVLLGRMTATGRFDLAAADGEARLYAFRPPETP